VRHPVAKIHQMTKNTLSAFRSCLSTFSGMQKSNMDKKADTTEAMMAQAEYPVQLELGLHGPIAAPITASDERNRKKMGLRMEEWSVLSTEPSKPGETAVRAKREKKRAPQVPKYPLAFSVFWKSPM